MKKQIYITFCSLLLLMEYGYAQLVNLGDLSISNDTEVSVLENFQNESTGNIINDGSIYFYQNYNNSGQFSYTVGNPNGAVLFVGSNLQEIWSPSMSLFYNVIFNNPTISNAFRLQGSVFIDNEANFLSGILENAEISNSIIFGQNSNYSNVSNLSHIDGNVHKEGNTSFTFPVGGNGHFRPLEISAPDASGDLYAARYFFENSDNLYPHRLSRGTLEFIDTNEYWSLTREQGSSEVLVTLTWNENTTSRQILDAERANLRIVRWDDHQGFWVDEGGVVNESSQSVTTVARISEYGIFALATVKEGAILPGGISVYNLITPDGDGNNDFLRIEGLDAVTDAAVEVFNRNGVKVFETSNYNNTTNVFRGFSDGRATISKGEQLPTGTYFYILNYTYNSQRIKKAGYLYINGKQ